MELNHPFLRTSTKFRHPERSEGPLYFDRRLTASWTLRGPLFNVGALCVLPLLFFLATTLQAQRYSRPILLPHTNHPTPNTCLILDSTTYAHSAPTLTDLRIHEFDHHEIPYAITLSGPSSTESTPAAILNQTLRSPTRLTFDLQTPPRPYSALDLTLTTQNFIATVKLTGLRSLDDMSPTYLGTFTLYDLTAQHLGQDAHLEFAESNFPYVHLDIELSPSPGAAAPKLRLSNPIVNTIANPLALVTSARFPSTRQSQTLYTPLATTQAFTQTPTETITTIQLPRHVPVERITFDLDPIGTANFNRTVAITAQSSAPNTPAETITGTISRVHTNLLGHRIAHESLSVPAILGSNARDAATVTITIQNDSAPPLKIRAITLEMRQRKLCFPTPAAATLTYGDPTRTASNYPFATTFNPTTTTQIATLGPESYPLLPDAILPPRPSLTNPPPRLTLALVATLLAASALSMRLFKRR
jgi:hypothetical protein